MDRPIKAQTNTNEHKRAQMNMIEHKQRPNEHDQTAGTSKQAHNEQASPRPRSRPPQDPDHAGPLSRNSEHAFEDKDEPHELQGWTMSGRLVSSMEWAKRPSMHTTIARLHLSSHSSPISIPGNHTRLSQSVQ